MKSTNWSKMHDFLPLITVYLQQEKINSYSKVHNSIEYSSSKAAQFLEYLSNITFDVIDYPINKLQVIVAFDESATELYNAVNEKQGSNSLIQREFYHKPGQVEEINSLSNKFNFIISKLKINDIPPQKYGIMKSLYKSFIGEKYRLDAKVDDHVALGLLADHEHVEGVMIAFPGIDSTIECPVHLGEMVNIILSKFKEVGLGIWERNGWGLITNEVLSNIAQNQANISNFKDMVSAIEKITEARWIR